MKMTFRHSNLKRINNQGNASFPVHQLIYISKAVNIISTHELSNILKTAHQFNQDSNISGALFYNQDLFFQLLEGEKNTINTLFADHISKDKRHSQVYCFYQRPVEKRTFPNWNMALYGKNNHEIINLCQLDNDEITSIENFFQDQITQHFKDLVTYFKSTLSH